MTIRRAVELLLPPLAMDILRSIKRAVLGPGDGLTYAPLGWQTKLPPGEPGWGDPRLIARERKELEPFIERLAQGEPPLVEPDGSDAGHPCVGVIGRQNEYMIYAVVLELIGPKEKFKILDYGGCFADYYWITRALSPRTSLEYHCKDLPAAAAEGRRLSPEVFWHTDDVCLDRRYDLVIFNNSLQYIEDWRDILRRACAAADEYLYLANVPTVERGSGYAAVERLESARMLHWQFSRDSVTSLVESAGLRLVREFSMGNLPPIANAPEPAAYRGWLFKRVEARV